jgi:hypothetical protein
MASPDQLATASPFLLSVAQASQRAMGMFLVGATCGLCWGAVRGTGPLWMYPLHIGGNFAFVTLPCFAMREVIGSQLPDPAASALSGAIGGAAVMTVYTGARSAPKAALAFGLAGLGVERMNQAFLDYKVRKREEIMMEQKEASSKQTTSQLK